MELLKRKIIEHGEVITEEILRVDSIINHCIDPQLMDKIADEFAAKFRNSGINKIITIESSGIAPAVLTGLKLNVPVVFAKKKKPSTMVSEIYTSTVHSFTKQSDYDICVSSSFLKNGDLILIIDDFLAHGSAAEALIDIVHKAGASVAGIGIIIEKGFQQGGEILRSRGFRVESLAIIDKMYGNKIRFRN